MQPIKQFSRKIVQRMRAHPISSVTGVFTFTGASAIVGAAFDWYGIYQTVAQWTRDWFGPDWFQAMMGSHWLPIVLLLISIGCFLRIGHLSFAKERILIEELMHAPREITRLNAMLYSLRFANEDAIQSKIEIESANTMLQELKDGGNRSSWDMPRFDVNAKVHDAARTVFSTLSLCGAPVNDNLIVDKHPEMIIPDPGRGGIFYPTQNGDFFAIQQQNIDALRPLTDGLSDHIARKRQETLDMLKVLIR